MAGLNKNKQLCSIANKYIPGGVNSPVRSFKSVGGNPIFFKRGCGSKLYSESNKEFIDYCLSWGALILGHANPAISKSVARAAKNGTSFGTATKLEVELAKLIVEAVPSVEQARLTNSGTEAVMSAVRLARAFTRKNKIIKFDGSYHGHADYLLVKAGSGNATLGLSNSLGVPRDFTRHTLVLPFNNTQRLEQTVKQNQKDLAALIVEPVAANCGVIPPQPGFLQFLRKITAKYGIVLIFDEVITGFRLAYGGAQEYFKVKPDLTCLGKIVGGGLPLAVFGGRKEIMQLLAPVGGVYQAGTLAGNPVAVSAGIAALKQLKGSNIYSQLENSAKDMCSKIQKIAQQNGIELKINQISSMFSLFFTNQEVTDYAKAKTQNLKIFNQFFNYALKRGVYFSPSGFEANFLSTAHSKKDLDKTLKIIDQAFQDLRRI